MYDDQDIQTVLCLCIVRPLHQLHLYIPLQASTGPAQIVPGRHQQNHDADPKIGSLSNHLYLDSILQSCHLLGVLDYTIITKFVMANLVLGARPLNGYHVPDNEPHLHVLHGGHDASHQQFF